MFTYKTKYVYYSKMLSKKLPCINIVSVFCFSDDDEEEEKSEALKPKLTFNPHLQRLYQVRGHSTCIVGGTMDTNPPYFSSGSWDSIYSVTLGPTATPWNQSFLAVYFEILDLPLPTITTTTHYDMHSVVKRWRVCFQYFRYKMVLQLVYILCIKYCRLLV